MKHSRILAALATGASLAVLAAASPALASFNPNATYAPTGSTAVAPSATPGSIGGGWIDALGNIWGVTASNTITPSGEPTSGNNGGLTDILLRPSSESAQNQGIGVNFNMQTNGVSENVVCHYNNSGSASSPSVNDYFLNVGNGGFNLYKTVNNAISVVKSGSWNPVNGANFAAQLGCNVNGNTTTLTGTLTNSGGQQVASISASDTNSTLAAAGVVGVYQYVPTANYNFPINSLTTYTYSPPQVTSVTNSVLKWSPGNWDLLKAATSDYGVTTDSMQAYEVGATLRFDVTGSTSAGIQLDTTPWSSLSGTVLTAFYSIDDGPRQNLTLNNATVNQLFFSNTLSTGKHQIEFQIVTDPNPSGGTRWSTSSSTSPTEVLRINGVLSDSGATVSTFDGYLAPTKTCYVYGDSLSEGYLAVDGVNSASYDSFVQPICTAMGAEVGQIPYGGQGITMSNNVGQTPAFTSTWNAFSVGRPRATTADYVFEVQGTNDFGASASAATVQSTELSWIQNERAAFGTASWLFVVTPPDGAYKAALDGAVASYVASSPSDTKVVRIDVQDLFPPRSLVSPGTPNQQAIADGLHLQVDSHAKFAAAVAARALAATQVTIKAGTIRSGTLH